MTDLPLSFTNWCDQIASAETAPPKNWELSEESSPIGVDFMHQLSENIGESESLNNAFEFVIKDDIERAMSLAKKVFEEARLELESKANEYLEISIESFQDQPFLKRQKALEEE